MADVESSSVQSVISNDDLLTEILVRLPAVSLILFKSVSKLWFSLIKHAANLTFCRNRNLDPPSGLFIHKYTTYTKYNGFNYYGFVPFDIRIPLLATNSFTFGPEVKNECKPANIIDSCNGLLLCPTLSRKLYVCNPSITNMFKVLPKPDNATWRWYHSNHGSGGLKMAFDPTKSPHYKVIYAETVHAFSDIRVQIHTFSSETGDWSLCGHLFFEHCFCGFRFGVYWNDAIYWATRGKVFKLDIMNEHPVLTTLPTPPLTVDERLRSSYPMFVSRGCLLFVHRHIAPSRRYTIYEKGNVYSEWSVKYTFNLDDIIPYRFSRREEIFCVVLGEREEDSFLVWRLGRKVVQHKIVSKTLITISDFEPNDNLQRCFQFIPSFANVRFRF